MEICKSRNRMSNSEKEIIEKDVQLVHSGVLLKDVIHIEYAKKAVETYMNYMYGKKKMESEEQHETV